MIGNFLGDRLPLETIRASFKRSIPLTSDVRIESLNSRILSKICALIGSLLTLDSVTRHKLRPSFAKAMVEIDLLEPLIEKFWIDFEHVMALGGGVSRRKFGKNRLPEVVVVAGKAQTEEGVVAEAMAEEGRRRGFARLESQQGEGEEGSRREEIGSGHKLIPQNYSATTAISPCWKWVFSSEIPSMPFK
nr:TMV resistance protein N-like [Ipomoea batatas]